MLDPSRVEARCKRALTNMHAASTVPDGGRVGTDFCNVAGGESVAHARSAAVSRLSGSGRRLLHALFLCLFTLVLATGCVVDRTGQSRSLSLQQDLAETHTQVQGLQRQVDDQLHRTSARLVEMEENAELNRRNLADSGAILDTMVSEMQGLRGTFEQVSYKLSQNDQRSERLQEDLEFRLQEIEKRLVALEKAQAALMLASPQGEGGAELLDASESGEKLTGEETLKKARGYFDGGNYKISLAFLRSFKKRFPQDPGNEEAQFLLAESLRLDGDLKSALQEYQVLVDTWPKSSRIPSVMLRQGESFVALGDKEAATLFFNELVRGYPRSPEAETAKARLKELQ